ncbi:MAG: hypothetical protein ACE5H9_19460 [Anaerolineae bacterium]
MESLVILFVLWLIIGLLVSFAAPNLFRGERPYGLNGDLAVSVIVVILVGLADWYLLPLILPNLARLFRFLITLVEPAVGALLVLWLMRRFKR